MTWDEDVKHFTLVNFDFTKMKADEDPHAALLSAEHEGQLDFAAAKESTDMDFELRLNPILGEYKSRYDMLRQCA